MNVDDYVTELAALAQVARARLAPAPRANQPAPAASAPVVAIVSPHPDDECIIGGLALRLAMECGWRVVNIAVTQGSNPERQSARAAELRAACDYLGFECVFFGERGLSNVNPGARAARDNTDYPGAWQANVTTLAQKLNALKPALILAPHQHDAQPTHVGTHWLTRDALAEMSTDFSTHIAFTEYWSTMESPNLLVAQSAPQVGQMISALMLHAGEVARNPYHTSLPMWMMDNVRRGSERVGAAGGAVANFDFGTCYDLQHWQNGSLKSALNSGRILTLSDSPDAIFR
jgi:N-acetylglucosamine malate deacetylase 1